MTTTQTQIASWTRPFPTDPDKRQAARDQALEVHVLRGTHAGLHSGLSMRCDKGDHGCRNDGTGCLCLCHDGQGGLERP